MIHISSLSTFLLKSIQSRSEETLPDNVDRYITNSPNFEWSDIFSDGFRTFLPLYFETNAFAKTLEMPLKVSERFKFCCMHNVAKNQKNIHAIKDLACVFEKSGIKLVFLKGAAYLGTIYSHDTGVRLMADVDVLVKKSELEEAKKILEKEGFTQDYKRVSQEMGRELTENYFLQYHFHYVFYRDDVKLELHWDISPWPCQTVLDKIFDSLVTIRLDTTEIYTVSPEASLFIECINFLSGYGYLTSIDFVSSKYIDRYAYNLLFFLYEFKKLSGYYRNTINWDTFFFFCYEHEKFAETLTLLFYAYRFIHCETPEAVLRKKKERKVFGFYVFLLRYVEKNDFIKAFMLRNIVLYSGDFKLFRKNPTAFMLQLFRLIGYYLSFDNPARAFILKGAWRLTKPLRIVLNFLSCSSAGRK